MTYPNWYSQKVFHKVVEFQFHMLPRHVTGHRLTLYFKFNIPVNLNNMIIIQNKNVSKPFAFVSGWNVSMEKL